MKLSHLLRRILPPPKLLTNPGKLTRSRPSALAIALALPVVGLLASPSPAPDFTVGPAVRVTANDEIEFEWITDITWYGRVTVFDNPDGTGTSVLVRNSLDAINEPVKSQHHMVMVPVNSFPLTNDTGYFFRVTSIDPTGGDPPFSTPTPLPPFFTGLQAIDNLFVQPGIHSALISWQANVIGFGQVAVGSRGDGVTLTDSFNVTDHAIEVTGLSPGTTYPFSASNLHAVGGDALVEQTGSFTTLSPVVGDYNQNGTVDAADYVVWRKTLGQTSGPLAADGNGDGKVDPSDYDAWRAHFGQTLGSGNGSAGASPTDIAVPESATSLLLLLGALFTSLHRRAFSRPISVTMLNSWRAASWGCKAVAYHQVALSDVGPGRDLGFIVRSPGRRHPRRLRQ